MVVLRNTIYNDRLTPLAVSSVDPSQAVFQVEFLGKTLFPVVSKTSRKIATFLDAKSADKWVKADKTEDKDEWWG